MGAMDEEEEEGRGHRPVLGITHSDYHSAASAALKLGGTRGAYYDRKSVFASSIIMGNSPAAAAALPPIPQTTLAYLLAAIVVLGLGSMMALGAWHLVTLDT